MTLELTPVLCAACGITFAVPREYFDARVADQRAFTCPNACPVRLGVESSTDRQVRALGATVDSQRRLIVDLTEGLEEARQAYLANEAEIARLQSAVVHYELGPATAVEER